MPAVLRSTLLLYPALILHAVAQESAMLSNAGGPIRVPFACQEEELASAGMDCSEDQPCPVYLELSGVAGAGDRIFLSGNLHSASATLDSILLTSADDGATWREPSPRMRGAAIDELQFVDASHGWAGGETQYPLARDPFFLITSDSGATWLQQPVFDDGGPGSIQGFVFDSAQTGSLIIDSGGSAQGGRFTSWETHTGGTSWSMLGASDKPDKLQPPSSQSAVWRVRAARDGTVWQLEKLTGAAWSSAASFAVDVARCVSKPVERKEAPAANEEPTHAAGQTAAPLQ